MMMMMMTTVHDYPMMQEATEDWPQDALQESSWKRIRHSRMMYRKRACFDQRPVHDDWISKKICATIALGPELTGPSECAPIHDSTLAARSAMRRKEQAAALQGAREATE
jgi:hypothetical protein